MNQNHSSDRESIPRKNYEMFDDVGVDKIMDANMESIEANSANKKSNFEPLEDTAYLNDIDNSPNMDVILDIPVTVSMEVGSTEMSIRNLLQLNQGSVVELDRLAGDALDVLVNGTLIAHGEVVVINEKFGIRLTDIMSPSERISRLK